MCGICGYYSIAKTVTADKLKKMNDTLSHRGPDFGSEWVEGSIGFGHRRLSIIDLSSGGNQPMHSFDNRYVLVFNGEIYNYLDLKSELKTAGYSFRSESDTEVILNGFHHWQAQVFEKLNGIFALAIWDKVTQSLTLARDRLGVKPLYYHRSETSLIFGSEIKSILASDDYRPQVSFKALHEFMYYGNPLGENTMFDGITKVMPGQYLVANKTDITTDYFWKHEDLLPELKDISEQEAIAETRRLLENAVQRQLMSDVPVGVFLSGGIDSSSITAFASKWYGGKLRTYSAGFDFNGGHDELPLAKKIAQKYGTDHHEMMINGGDLSDIILKLVTHHDEPFSDAANIPLYLMTEKIKHECKVILQGDGGDEMFGGYNRYHLLQKYDIYRFGLRGLKPIKNLLPLKSLRQRVDRFYPIFTESDEGKMFALLLTMETDEDSPVHLLHPRFAAKMYQSNPFEYYQTLTKRFSYIDDKVQKMLWIDSKIILPDQFLEKVDKSTMANGVEVRVPFLDNELVTFAMRLPAELKLKNGIKKYILKKALEGIVPNEVLYGPKKGFGVPYDNWLKDPLNAFMVARFNSPYIKSLNLFNTQLLELKIKEHTEGSKNNGFILWKLLNLCIWLETYKIEIKE